MTAATKAVVMPAVDVVTVELVKNALNGVAQEMQTTLERTAHSQAIREVGDASSALFDIRGRLIAQALSLPVQLADRVLRSRKS